MLSKLNHELADVVVLLHLEGSESTFQGLSHVRFTKQLIELDDKFAPIALDQFRKRGCHQSRAISERNEAA